MPDESQPVGSANPAEKPAEQTEKKEAAPAPETQAKPAAPPAVPAEKPAAAAAAPAAAAKPPAAPPKPPVPKPDPWNSPLIERLRQSYGSGLREASTWMKQNYMVVDKSVVAEVLRILRDEEKFDYLVDVTAVHYPKREEQFDVVWILYSFPHNSPHSRQDRHQGRRSGSQRGSALAHRQLAGARSVRHVRHSHSPATRTCGAS